MFISLLSTSKSSGTRVFECLEAPNLVNVALPRESAFALAGSCWSVCNFLGSTTMCRDEFACSRIDGLG